MSFPIELIDEVPRSLDEATALAAELTGTAQRVIVTTTTSELGEIIQLGQQLGGDLDALEAALLEWVASC